MIRRIFIGFDERQPVAYQVAAASIAKKSSVPVSITPLILRQLPLRRRGLTDFSFSRYLVPYLCNYEGHALFVDADILCLGDIAELPWDTEAAVSVVKHTTVLKGGQPVNVQFERPSVMLFNCEQCPPLSLDLIEQGTPQKLETWAHSVGELPREWNYLVGYDKPFPKHVTGCFSQDGACSCEILLPKVKLAHFTQGIPIFEETCNDEYASEWLEMAKWCGESCSWQEIMGNSVHAKWKQKPAIASFLQLQGFG